MNSLESYGVSNLLTKKQQVLFTSIEKNFQLTLEGMLNSEEKESIHRAQLVVRIIECCDRQEIEGIFEKYFLTLLDFEGEEIDRSFSTVLDFSKKGYGEAFFKFVSTQKKEYYSASDLIEIVNLFNHLLQHLPLSFSLSSLLPYDRGGKGYVDELLKRNFQTDKRTTSPFIPDLPTLKGLIACDAYFPTMRKEALRYLSSLSEDKRSPIPVYLTCFNQLQSDPKISFGDHGRGGFLKLLLLVTTKESGTLPQQYTSSDFNKLLEMVKNIYQKYGKELLNIFYLSPGLQEGILEEVVEVLRQIFIAEDTAYEMPLNHFSRGEISLRQFLEILEKGGAFDPDDGKRDIDAVLSRFKEKSSMVPYPLDPDEIETIKQQYLKIDKYCQDWKDHTISTLVNQAWEIREKRKVTPLNEWDILQLIAIGRLSIRLKFGIYPYDTQILTLLGMLLNSQGRIAQVKTGEGKSTIVTLMAFVFLMQGRAADIISSSRNLAIRDQQKYASFFQTFRLLTSHICMEKQTKEMFRAHLIYGTATDFEFALMHEKSLFVMLFQERIDHTDIKKNFDCIVVDEIDNLTIDTLMNGARMSWPAEVSYEWVYDPIIQFVRENLLTQLIYDPDIVLKLLKNYLENYMGGRFKNLIKDLTDRQLKRWQISARHVLLNLKENKDYIIRENEIVIVDANNTGRVIEGSRWSYGIHEFVETVHSIPVKKESLNPISYSHPVFYNHYSCMCGLTGTVGSPSEVEKIKTIYGIDSFASPPHLPSRREDKPPVILNTDKEYFKKILESVQLMIKRKRPVLILTETIHDSYFFEKYLKENKVVVQMLNEVQEEDENSVIRKAGLAGTITVATNTAGRGTDIVLDNESIKNGGLHVILTFYADSERVEDQAKGRAGRQGQPGSSEIFLSSERIKTGTLSDLILKRKEIEENLKEVHSRRALSDRYSAEFTQVFYKLLNDFHVLMNSESFLKRVAKAANKIRLIKIPVLDLSSLHPKDVPLAQETISLLNKKSGVDTETRWISFLKQIGERIEDKVIVEWSTKFYQPQETIMVSSEDIEEIKRDVNELYDENKECWEKYLESSGKGIAVLLKEIAKVNLVNLFK